VLFHYFDQFVAEYESRFEKEYGFLRPIIKEVVERYLDCGNPDVGLPASGVPIVVKSGSFTFPAAAGDFAHRAIQRGGRNGQSG